MDRERDMLIGSNVEALSNWRRTAIEITRNTPVYGSGKRC
jgi:hypothetical protein